MLQEGLRILISHQWGRRSEVAVGTKSDAEWLRRQAVAGIVCEAMDRQGIGAKELAHKIGCEPESISQYRNGRHLPNANRRRRLAEALGVSVSALITGKHLDRPAAATGHRAASIGNNFVKEASCIVGSSLQDFPYEIWGPSIASDCLARMVAPSEAAIVEIDELSSGHELKAALVVLDMIIGLMWRAYTEGIVSARQVLFAANEKHVHCHQFVDAPNLIEARTHGSLATMALLALDGRLDRALKARLYAQAGDVLRISATVKQENEERCRKFLQASFEMAPGRGYLSIRNLPIVLASWNITDAEFEKVIRRAEDARQIGHLSPHEVVHSIDGLISAYIGRYKKTSAPKYRAAALQCWELHRHESKAVTDRLGTHAEFSLRGLRASVELGLAGILDHFGADERASHDHLVEQAENLVRRATHAGSDRVGAWAAVAYQHAMSDR